MKFWYLSLLSAFCQSENIFKKVIAVFKKEVNFQSEFSLYVDPQFETEIIKGIIRSRLMGTVYQPENFFWLPMSTGYRPETIFWVLMGTWYRPNFERCRPLV